MIGIYKQEEKHSGELKIVKIPTVDTSARVRPIPYYHGVQKKATLASAPMMRSMV